MIRLFLYYRVFPRSSPSGKNSDSGNSFTDIARWSCLVRQVGGHEQYGDVTAGSERLHLHPDEPFEMQAVDSSFASRRFWVIKRACEQVAKVRFILRRRGRRPRTSYGSQGLGKFFLKTQRGGLSRQMDGLGNFFTSVAFLEIQPQLFHVSMKRKIVFILYFYVSTSTVPSYIETYKVLKMTCVIYLGSQI